jgi:hypothetical protein
VLERSFVGEHASPLITPPRHVTRIRVYRGDAGSIDGGDRAELLEGSAPVTPLKKTLVVDGARLAPQLSGPERQLENFEAMTVGPRLPDGCPSPLLLTVEADLT